MLYFFLQKRQTTNPLSPIMKANLNSVGKPVFDNIKNGG